MDVLHLVKRFQGPEIGNWKMTDQRPSFWLQVGMKKERTISFKLSSGAHKMRRDGKEGIYKISASPKQFLTR